MFGFRWITIPVALSTLVVTDLADAKVSERDRRRVIKQTAEVFAEHKHKLYKVTGTSFDDDSVTMNIRMNDPVAVEPGAALEAFSTGFCKLEAMKRLVNYNFSVIIALEVSGFAPAMKELNGQSCLPYFALSNDFGRADVPEFYEERADQEFFQFQDLEAGQNIGLEFLSGCRLLHETGLKQLSCWRGHQNVAGAEANMSVDIYRGRISSLELEFNSIYFEGIVRAFIAKYGAPCDTRDKGWQNQMGNTFSNPELFWCFKSGTLRVTARTDKRDESEAVYLDVNSPPRKGPTVNF